MKQIIRKLEVKIRYVIWAITQLKEPTSYDTVIFNGRQHWIEYANPHWKIKNIPGQLKKQDFKIVRGFKRDIRVFKQRYKFQKTSWYSIDYRNPFFTRISYMSSDNIHFQKH